MDIVTNLKVKEEYQIKNDILNNLNFDISKIEGTYAYELASAHAIEIKKLYNNLNNLFPELFPWSCTQEPYLSDHLKRFGLTRRKATNAEGIVTITGKVGARINLGTIVISRLGIKYKTATSEIISDAGDTEIKIECLESGTIGNCGIGDITTFEIANTDIYTVTNKEKISNGVDIETVEMAKARMEIKATTPSHSGNKNDYLMWCKSISGVGKVEIWGAGEKEGVNAGQVEIMISNYDYKLASQELIEEVQNYINVVKIVNADVNIKSFLEKKININGSIKISSETTIEDVKNDFIRLLNQKLTTNDFIIEGVLSIGKIGNLIFMIDGVIDFKNLKLNGTTSSIELMSEELAILSEVSFEKWE